MAVRPVSTNLNVKNFNISSSANPGINILEDEREKLLKIPKHFHYLSMMRQHQRNLKLRLILIRTWNNGGTGNEWYGWFSGLVLDMDNCWRREVSLHINLATYYIIQCIFSLILDNVFLYKSEIYNEKLYDIGVLYATLHQHYVPFSPVTGVLPNSDA